LIHRLEKQPKEVDMIEILKEIEAKYPVNQIVVNGEQVWPYLRARYYVAHSNRYCTSEGEKGPSSIRVPIRQRLHRYVYGARNWVGKYKYVAISSSSSMIRRRNINEKYFNVLIDPIVDLLGQDNVLVIETTPPVPYPISKLHTKRVFPRYPLDGLASLLGKTTRHIYNIEGEHLLTEINKAYELDIDYRGLISKFLAEKNIMSILFRIIKPAVLFNVYSTSNISAVKAAKDLGIVVVEFQHGAVNGSPVYNIAADSDKSFFPDYLLAFGKQSKKYFNNSHFINANNVYPIGNFYIEYIRNNYVPTNEFKKLTYGYNRIVGISLQRLIQKRTLRFIYECAYLDKGILYILIPRLDNNNISGLENMTDTPDNVIAVTNLNFYEIMMGVDFHATVCSTCALEAPSLGVQNILINIDNTTKQFCEDLLSDACITRHVHTPKEFVQQLNSCKRLEGDTVIELNKDNIEPNNEYNIRSFINQYLNSME